MKNYLLLFLTISLGSVFAGEIYTPMGKKVAQQTVSASPKDVVQNVSSVVTGEPSATLGGPGKQGVTAQANNARFSRVSYSSDPGRFKNIMTTPEVASDEIDFWVRQLSEHALFLYLGIEEPNLKAEALKLHQKFEDFRTKFNGRPNDIALMNTVFPLLQQEREFKVRVLQALDAGKWIGWIFPLFVNHTILELDYLVDKLNGKQYSAEDELMFWNRINSEHAAFAAHLLDPAERELFLSADQASQKFFDIPTSEMEMWVKLSITASEELDKFNKTARSAGPKAVKSVIHSVLLEHVIREGERSIKTLKSLGLEKEGTAMEALYSAQVMPYMEN
jgi:hypothetical protein